MSAQQRNEPRNHCSVRTCDAHRSDLLDPLLQLDSQNFVRIGHQHSRDASIIVAMVFNFSDSD